MDTKSKKSYKVLNTILVILVLVAVLVSGMMAKDFNREGRAALKKEEARLEEKGYEYENSDIPAIMIEGSYALYAEEMNTWEDDLISDFNNQDYIKSRFDTFKENFGYQRKYVDYAIIKREVIENQVEVEQPDVTDDTEDTAADDETSEDETAALTPEPVYETVYETKLNLVSTNATDDLLYFVPDYVENLEGSKSVDYLKDKYVLLITLEYDAQGKLSISNSYNADGLASDFVRDIMAYQNYVQYSEEGIGAGAPRNTVYVYAISRDCRYYPNYSCQDDIDPYEIYYYNTGYISRMWMILGALAVAALILGRPWAKNDGSEGVLYLELAILVGVFVILFVEAAFDIYYGYAVGDMDTMMFCGCYALFLTPYYLLWCGAVISLKTLVIKGWREYISNHCFIGVKRNEIREYRQMLRDEIEHLNLEDDKNRTIKKVVVINFILLSLVCCMWVAGPVVLIFYALIVARMMKKHAARTRDQLRLVKDAAADIASGDFATDKLKQDMGMYNDLKDELINIADGFSDAVIEETRSSRMKTELVTNVSHDLKTPLTAITTYVELLKDPDLDEEKRQEYIDVLERKSLRLKVLIEDLFELSKASSDTMTLECSELNICHLIKQVAAEQEDKLSERRLRLIYNMPEEIILNLDGAKAYRIFENLFVNAAKYALEGTRVYVDAEESKELGQVVITMVNVSESELNFNEQEITERFVRGDVSRNTEGSGLGLAIVKSFTEAMGGTFEIKTDKDLFKAIVTWKK
ncbi:MAG: HAMP domain-containing histidine kinase [Pseudobutyrivibrio sp.]|nr:HAMP domain-containing histidine kinase [Pseudobutyrivibrio sp.]